MSTLGDVSIVIVNYNTGAMLGSLLAALRSLPVARIVVVDNASVDQSADAIKSTDTTHLISNTTNLGFARACKQGVAQTGSDWVLLLNPDCQISPEGLSDLLSLADKQPKAGLCAPLVLDQQGNEQSGSRRPQPTPWRIIRAYLGQRDALDWRGRALPEQPLTQPAVSGACMLVRRSSWDAVGGMDEQFFLHFEDLDLMQRLQQHDWQVWLHPQVRVTHVGGHSGRGRALRVAWHKHISLLRYLRKHEPRSLLTWTLMPLLAMLHFLAVAVMSPLKRLAQT